MARAPGTESFLSKAFVMARDNIIDCPRFMVGVTTGATVLLAMNDYLGGAAFYGGLTTAILAIENKRISRMYREMPEVFENPEFWL